MRSQRRKTPGMVALHSNTNLGRLRQGDEELKASFGCKVRLKNKENQREVLKEREIQRKKGRRDRKIQRERRRREGRQEDTEGDGEKSPGWGAGEGRGRAGGSHTDNIHG